MKAIARFSTLLLLFPFLIWQFLMFDRLVRLEYENFRGAWEHDVCPHGFFWKPPQSGLFPSPMRYMARGTVAVMWFVVTPSWMQQDEIARLLVSRFRRLWLGFILIGLPAFGWCPNVVLQLDSFALR